ncbi:MAG: MBOAT family protein, partial [Oscillospiraceae bacterium]
MVLIAFSMFFYAWGEPIWISLLLFSAAIDYVHGLVIEKYRGRLGAKLAVASSLVLNLGLLGIFKYSGFLYSTLNSLFGLQLNVPAFALPIGISFYTFQTISYTIDVYRGDAEPQHSFAEFLMYVSLYFQLVAGPIVRYRDVAVEINHRHETVEELSRGFNRFCIGLGKKVLIANTAGRLAAPYLDGQLASLTTLGAWFGI